MPNLPENCKKFKKASKSFEQVAIDGCFYKPFCQKAVRVVRVMNRCWMGPVLIILFLKRLIFCLYVFMRLLQRPLCWVISTNVVLDKYTGLVFREKCSCYLAVCREELFLEIPSTYLYATVWVCWKFQQEMEFILCLLYASFFSLKNYPVHLLLCIYRDNLMVASSFSSWCCNKHPRNGVFLQK